VRVGRRTGRPAPEPGYPPAGKRRLHQAQDVAALVAASQTEAPQIGKTRTDPEALTQAFARPLPAAGYQRLADIGRIGAASFTYP